MQKYSQVGISFPKDILSKTDTERGDVSRSRYILRQLEKVSQTGESSRSPRPVETELSNGGKSNG